MGTINLSENDHVQGNELAAIELIEYGDYQCPYCGQAYPIVKHIQEVLGSRLKFVFRNFPLRKIHPQAMAAALASEAAGLQGKFWEMHDILFENQNNLDHNSILSYARTLGLDAGKFNEDIASPELEKKVLSDFQSGLLGGVNATPTFFVNGLQYDGDWSSGDFLKFLKKIV
jgi:protein-disulfide isomerase